MNKEELLLQQKDREIIELHKDIGRLRAERDFWKTVAITYTIALCAIACFQFIVNYLKN